VRSLRPNTLRAIREVLRAADREDLVKAVDSALRPKRAVTSARKVRRIKTAARRQKTSDIRDLVAARASGSCEACGSVHELQLDHFFGGSSRKALESVDTCWLLCAECHRQKTVNLPSPTVWLARFMIHAKSHGYTTAYGIADNRFRSLQLQGRD